MRRTNDHYSRMAKAQGYPARSVYKLQEIQRKHHLVRTGDSVLDIGAYPGSFSRYLLTVLNGRGKLVAVDLEQVSLGAPAEIFVALRGNIFEDSVLAEIERRGPYGVVISDAAPSTSGNAIVDTTRSMELSFRVLEICERCLRQHGNLVLKVFQGGDEREILQKIKRLFSLAKGIKPEASRSESREVYYIGLDAHRIGGGE